MAHPESGEVSQANAARDEYYDRDHEENPFHNRSHFAPSLLRAAT
jgi:hypothetical protein